MAVHTEGDINRIRPFDKKIIAMDYLEKFSQLILCTEAGVEVNLTSCLSHIEIGDQNT